MVIGLHCLQHSTFSLYDSCLRLLRMVCTIQQHADPAAWFPAPVNRSHPTSLPNPPSYQGSTHQHCLPPAGAWTATLSASSATCTWSPPAWGCTRRRGSSLRGSWPAPAPVSCSWATCAATAAGPAPGEHAGGSRLKAHIRYDSRGLQRSWQPEAFCAAAARA